MIVQVHCKSDAQIMNQFLWTGQRGGSVVDCRAPEREVGGSKATPAVLCP